MKHLTNQKTFGNLCLLLLLWVFSTSSVLLPKNKNAYGVSFFTGTLQSALIVTQTRDLPLFVLLYEPYTLSDMESTVFNQKDVELFYNSHFFNCKIKSDSEDGKYLIEKYNLSNLPALLFFNSSEYLLLQDAGEKTQAALLTLGNKALQENINNKHSRAAETKLQLVANVEKNESTLDRGYIQLLEYQIKYENGYANTNFLYDYAYLLHQFNEPYDAVIAQYLAGISIPDLSSEKNVRFVYDFSGDIHSPAFSLLLSNKQYYIGLLGKQKIEQRIAEALIAAAITAAANKNRVLLNEALSALKKSGISSSIMTEQQLRSLYFEKSGNWNDYSSYKIGQYKNGEGINPDELDDVAWKFVLHVDNELKLEKALLWTQENMRQFPSHFKYRETYAALLYRLNQKGKAKKEAQKAREIALQQGKNYGSTLALMDAMAKGATLDKNIRK